ncbi:hypothetical protein SO802_024105 [Lithocarpus litseifolius]|uniref:Uncharacterized protein n=1 Tax=Lithocarpus litseifolius TaxID=425828 RepID=A0AAW2CA29_9ROSI
MNILIRPSCSSPFTYTKTKTKKVCSQKNKMERKEMVPIISISFESLILYITYSMLQLERHIYQESDNSIIIFNSSIEENVDSNLLSPSCHEKKECKDLSP